jgi:hypothetical protein
MKVLITNKEDMYRSQLFARIGVVSATIASLFGPSVAKGASGQATSIPLPKNNGGAAGDFTSFVTNIVPKVINIILFISGTLAVFYLMFSGFQYITSAGNPDKIKNSRQGIINAIIGIVIIMSAYFLIRFATSIGNTVNSL